MSEEKIPNAEVIEPVIELSGPSRWQQMKMRLADLRPSKKSLGRLKKLGLAILTLVLMILAALATYWVGREFLTVKEQASSAVKIAGESMAKATSAENNSAQAMARANEIYNVSINLANTVGSVADSVGKLADQVEGLGGEVNANNAKLAGIETIANNASQAAAQAGQSAERAAKKAAAAVKETTVVKTQVETVMSKADKAEAQAKSAAVLANEAQVAAEAGIEAGRNAQEAADAAQEVAEGAADASGTAIKSVAIIAKQPTKFVGHSVGKKSKAAVKAELEAYYERSGVGPEIAAGAPEE